MGKLRLRATPVGDALLVHPKDRFDERAAVFARGLAHDPQHTLAVVDLPAEMLADEWAAVAKVLSSSRYGSLRLVFGRGRGDDVRTAAGRIADRLGREVLAPDGALVPTVAGGLFVPGDEGAAWLRFRPGRAVEPDSQRFPKPHWEFSVPTRPRRAGDRTTVRPVPSGVWLRPVGEPLSAADRRAVETLPTDTRHLLVVLGSPGGGPLPVDDVAGYWDTVLPNARSAVRFVLHGTLDTPASLPPGQGLANALDHEVVLYADLPSGPPDQGSSLPDHTTYTPAHGTAGPDHRVSAGGPGEVTASEGEAPRAGARAEPGSGTPSGPTALPGAEAPRGAAPESGTRPAPTATTSRDGVVSTRTAAGSGPQTPSTAAAQAGVGETLLSGEETSDGAATTVTVSADRPSEAGPGPSLPAPVPDGEAPPSAAPEPGERAPDGAATTVTASADGRSGARTDRSGAAPVPDGAALRGAASNSDARTSATATGSPDGMDPTPATAESGSEMSSTAPAQAGVDEPRLLGEQAPDGVVVAVTGSADRRSEERTDRSNPAPALDGAVRAGGSGMPETTPVVAARAASRGAVPRIRTESVGSETSRGAPGPQVPRTTPWPDSPARTVTSTGRALAGPETAPVVEPGAASGHAARERDPGAPGTGPEPTPVTPGPTAEGHDPDRVTVPTPDRPEATAPEAVPDVGTAPVPVRGPEGDPALTPVRADGVGPSHESRAEPGAAPRPVRPAAPRFRLESGAPAPEPETRTDPDPDPDPEPADGAGAFVAAPARPELNTPTGAAAGVRVQPVPRTAACALPPERGVAQERDWVRRTFSEQYNATAGSVSRMMSESPGLRGGSRTEAADALTELVAVRLYLSGDSRAADTAVRTATAGPHVPLARCVTAGLRRLPSYRGPALLRTRLQDAERAWYRADRLVTEWAFCHARTSLHAGPRGSGATDVLIWSMTARRTGSLDPAAPDRVVFLPGTSFKVLRTVGDAVLMREVSPSEIAEDGRVDLQRVKLDEIALKGLGNILDALEKAGTDAKAESADPPGLILTPDTGRAGRTEGDKP
ncbi:hypothetical protein [Streptomyces sp. NPDC048643]|uniref:hypothetical protein n=1 Tax=Streptomyces sp. NPDC048643 TaxID=3155637 RepID=UPI003429E1DE